MQRKYDCASGLRAQDVHRPETTPVIRIKRTYEPPSRGDGARFLVERLWPRGMKKEALVMDAWLKDVSPSAELRKWFGHRVERWGEFQRRYREELAANAASWQPILDAARHGPVTLLYSAHDTEHNGARVLCDFLDDRAAPRSRASGRSATAQPRLSRPASRGSAR
jgi:uncharacterized protein YeaO (DUF488 family)